MIDIKDLEKNITHKIHSSKQQHYHKLLIKSKNNSKKADRKLAPDHFFLGHLPVK